MPSVSMFVQCWCYQKCISRTIYWVVRLQVKLEVQTQQDGQIRSSFLSTWNILWHVKCLARKIQFAWFWIITSSNYKPQPSLWHKKMTFPSLRCHPIHQISYGYWAAPSVVHTEHMKFDLIIGYCKSRQTAIIYIVAVIIGKSFGKAFVKHKTGIYCFAWRTLSDIRMSPLHWICTKPKLTRSGRTSALQIRLIQQCTLMEYCKQLIEGETAWQWRWRLLLSI